MAFFWEDLWWGDRMLVEVFPRLYQLSKFKNYSVKDFLMKWQTSQRWQRPLRAWEDESAQTLQEIVDGINLSSGDDKLVWVTSGKQFSVKDCYESTMASNVVQGEWSKI